MKDYKYIQGLIDNYFEGLTSLKEEKILRDYFHGKHIPEEWKMYQPMFHYFSEEKQQMENKRPAARSIRLWISIAAAACILFFFGVNFILPSPDRLPAYSMIYIDGKKYTDIELVQTEALKALENLSENEEDVYTSQAEALDLFFSNH